MAFFVLDGIEVCKISRFSEPDALIADEARTAGGSFRRDVTAVGRSWNITTGLLTGDEFAALRDHLLQHVGRSLFWYRGFGGAYPQQARPVLVRASYEHRPGPGLNGAAPYLLTEDGDHLTTEAGERIVIDTLQPITGRDYLAGVVTLTITQVSAATPGGGWASTLGSEVLMIPGPAGPPGPMGPMGLPGPAGSSVLTGNGPPEETPGNAGDVYIDVDTGDVYKLT